VSTEKVEGRRWFAWINPDGTIASVDDGLHGEWLPVVPESELVEANRERDEALRACRMVYGCRLEDGPRHSISDEAMEACRSVLAEHGRKR